MAQKTEEPKTTKRTLHYFWREVVKYKWYSLGALISTPVVVFIRVVLGPLIFANLIGKVSDGIQENEIVSELLPQVLIYLGVYSFSSLIIEKLRLYWTWKMEVLAMYDLASLCFDTLSVQSMQFHGDRFSGSLVSQTNKFIGAFERLLDVLIWDLLPIVSGILFIVVVMWKIAPLFAVGIIVLVLIYTLISGITFKKIGHLNSEQAAAETKQTGQLADSITNIISVKSYAHEAHERHRYANFSRGAANANLKTMQAVLKRDVMFSGVNIGITAMILVFLIFGSEWLGISVATLILIVNYSQSVMSELWSINHIFRGLNRVFGDAHDMTLILDMQDDVVDQPDAQELVIQESAINFKNISFKHYDAKEAIFEDFNLQVQPGERVGLVGTSGSGKTTLTKLLLRFADVDQGGIAISDQNIKSITQQSLRQNIAYVPQETALFHRTVGENIAYGKLDATQEEIEHAAKLANAHEFIQDLPDGYNTLVGERGIKLSGGQRQRIAIARAILKDAPILVLDEATSALDSESEALIQDALGKLMAGRTSVVIAHRLSTVANLDRIVVLENGKIVEQGAHLELLEKSEGTYKHLWDRQSGAFVERK